MFIWTFSSMVSVYCFVSNRPHALWRPQRERTLIEMTMKWIRSGLIFFWLLTYFLVLLAWERWLLLVTIKGPGSVRVTLRDSLWPQRQKLSGKKKKVIWSSVLYSLPKSESSQSNLWKIMKQLNLPSRCFNLHSSQLCSVSKLDHYLSLILILKLNCLPEGIFTVSLPNNNLLSTTSTLKINQK